MRNALSYLVMRPGGVGVGTMSAQAHPGFAVFDVDGTLVDSRQTVMACLTTAFQGEGLPQPREEDVRRLSGLPIAACVAGLAPDLPSDRHDVLLNACRRAFFALREHVDYREPLFAGARETLDRLAKDGWRLGLATSKSRRVLEAVLESNGLLGHFASVQTGDVSPFKPDPEVLRRAMAEIGARPQETIMIGDTTQDMIMARAAGVSAFGVAWGDHSAADLRAAGAHRLVQNFQELPDAVFSLMDRMTCV